MHVAFQYWTIQQLDNFWLQIPALSGILIPTVFRSYLRKVNKQDASAINSLKKFFSKRQHSDSGSDAGSEIGRKKKKALISGGESGSDSDGPKIKKSSKGKIRKDSGSGSDSDAPKTKSSKAKARKGSGSDSDSRKGSESDDGAKGDQPKEEDIFGDDLSIR